MLYISRIETKLNTTMSLSTRIFGVNFTKYNTGEMFMPVEKFDLWNN